MSQDAPYVVGIGGTTRGGSSTEKALRCSLRAAEAKGERTRIFAGYHGSVSGLVKNGLDYLEDMRGDERVYLSGVPVGVIATGAGWQAIGTTLSTLRDIVHALRGWPTPLGAGVNTAGSVFDEEGACLDEKAGFQLRLVGEEVVEFARWRTGKESQS